MSSLPLLCGLALVTSLVCECSPTPAASTPIQDMSTPIPSPCNLVLEYEYTSPDLGVCLLDVCEDGVYQLRGGACNGPVDSAVPDEILTRLDALELETLKELYPSLESC